MTAAPPDRAGPGAAVTRGATPRGLAWPGPAAPRTSESPRAGRELDCAATAGHGDRDDPVSGARSPALARGTGTAGGVGPWPAGVRGSGQEGAPRGARAGLRGTKTREVREGVCPTFSLPRAGLPGLGGGHQGS